MGTRAICSYSGRAPLHAHIIHPYYTVSRVHAARPVLDPDKAVNPSTHCCTVAAVPGGVYTVIAATESLQALYPTRTRAKSREKKSAGASSKPDRSSIIIIFGGRTTLLDSQRALKRNFALWKRSPGAIAYNMHIICYIHKRAGATYL